MAAAAVSIKAKPPPLGLTDQQQQQQCRHICRAVTNNNWGKVRPVTCNICKLCFTIAAAPTSPTTTIITHTRHQIRSVTSSGPGPPKVLADSGHLSHCLMVGQLLPWQSLNRNRRLRRHPPPVDVRKGVSEYRWRKKKRAFTNAKEANLQQLHAGGKNRKGYFFINLFTVAWP